ncbi:MAG: hypothetical protein ACT4NV_12600 [Rhodoferax sp.]
MFERFRPKAPSAPQRTPQGPAAPRGMEVVEGDPDTAWGLWDEVTAKQQPLVREASADRRQALRQRSLEEAVAPPKPVRRALHTVMDAPVPAAVPVPAAARLEFEATRPLEEKEKSPAQRAQEALDIIELHHARIAKTLRTMWGHRECSQYIAQLLMTGYDDTGNARMGFHQEAVTAMLPLGDLHDTLFGFGEDEDATPMLSTSQWGRLGRR